MESGPSPGRLSIRTISRRIWRRVRSGTHADGRAFPKVVSPLGLPGTIVRRRPAIDEILVNKSTTGDQDQPGVAGFQGTQFIVVWADHQSNTIKAQLLGTDGLRHGSDTEFTVNFPEKAGTKRSLPTIIET